MVCTFTIHSTSRHKWEYLLKGPVSKDSLLRIFFMHERNIHAVTVLAGTCGTGLECRTTFLHCDIAFSLFIYIFLLGGERVKWWHHIMIIHGNSDNNSRDSGQSLHWKKTPVEKQEPRSVCMATLPLSVPFPYRSLGKGCCCQYY